MDRKIWLVLFALSIGVVCLLLFTQEKGDARIGKKIYEQGTLSNGEPLRTFREGGVTLEGAIVACAQCHRKSGFGSFEGNIYVPPITADILFTDQLRKREDLIRSLYHEDFTLRHWARIRKTGQRAAYDAQSLLCALAEGIDANGNPLDPIMPRYAFSPEDYRHLFAYLQTLNREAAPGIEQQTMHFATIITEDVAPEKEAALRNLIDTYVAWKNKSVEGDLKAAAASPNHKDAFHHTYLYWQPHYWKLSGPSDTWPNQLTNYYRQQKVFVLLSGTSEQSWSAVHAFAEKEGIPSIFPNVNWPVTQEDDYSLYFSRGAVGEATSLATYLAEQDAPLIQIHDPASAKSQKLKKSFEQAFPTGQILTYNIQDFSTLTAEKASFLAKAKPKINILLWLTKNEITELYIPDFWKEQAELYVINEAAETARISFPEFTINQTYPYALPEHKSPRNYRLRAWMRSRGLELSDEVLQMNTYYALSLTDFACQHLVGNYSREYLIERIEHEAENNLSPGIYPSLSLGAGQRFATKGNYILRMDSGEVLGWY